MYEGNKYISGVGDGMIHFKEDVTGFEISMWRKKIGERKTK